MTYTLLSTTGILVALLWICCDNEEGLYTKVFLSPLNVAKMSENYITEINQLIQVTDTPKRKVQSLKRAPEYEKFWFPTPETCPDPTNLSPLQRKILEQFVKTARCGAISRGKMGPE